MPRPLATLCLIAAMAMTGANVPLAKLLLAAMPPEVLLAMRFALASAVLALLVRAEPGPRLSSLTPRHWGTVAVLGLAGSVLFTWAVLEGVSRTSGASAGIILAALPAVVAAVGFALGERLRRGDLAMIVLAVAGVALIQGQSTAIGAEPATPAKGAGDQLLGNLFIGIAVLCEAAFVVAARGISRSLGPLRLSFAVALVSLAACLPFGLAGLARFDPASVGPWQWLLFVWYALTASIACTALWYRGVAHVERWMAGLATAAVPVSAVTVSALVLGERIEPAQLAGAALVIAAIAVGTLSQRSSRVTADPAP